MMGSRSKIILDTVNLLRTVSSFEFAFPLDTGFRRYGYRMDGDPVSDYGHVKPPAKSIQWSVVRETLRINDRLVFDGPFIQQNFQSPAGGVSDDAHTFRGVGMSPSLFKKLSLSRIFEMEGPPKELSMHSGTENSPVLLCESIGHQFGHGDGFADQIDVF